MSSSEPFAFISAVEGDERQPYKDYSDVFSARAVDPIASFSRNLRKQFPELTLAVVSIYNVDLADFARLGHASSELDIEHDGNVRLEEYVPTGPRGEPSGVGEVYQYAKHNYRFGGEHFIVFTLRWPYNAWQFILKEPRAEGETPMTRSALTYKLLNAAGDIIYKDSKLPGIWLFDRYWTKSRDLFQQVEKASWDKVILDEKMKTDLTSVAEKFFDSKDLYDELGVPWKRGLLFHGPPGNGKTVSIKALMHTLAHRATPIPTLYVRNAPGTFFLERVFTFARQMSPCMLVLEDVETLVNEQTRSYFFNEIDGLENNDGVLMVASTNFLDKLDPGLTNRPSRFDRKYFFAMPDEHERTLYAQYWRRKLESNDKVEFPEILCPAMANITEKFSFAYMQEAFVATLLEIARQEGQDGQDWAEGAKDGLLQYPLWRIFRRQVEILRRDMEQNQMARQ